MIFCKKYSDLSFKGDCLYIFSLKFWHFKNLATPQVIPPLRPGPRRISIAARCVYSRNTAITSLPNILYLLIWLDDLKSERNPYVLLDIALSLVSLHCVISETVRWPTLCWPRFVCPVYSTRSNHRYRGLVFPNYIFLNISKLFW